MMLFIFKCRNGHVVEISEDLAEDAPGEPCPTCWKPLYATGVKAR